MTRAGASRTAARRRRSAAALALVALVLLTWIAAASATGDDTGVGPGAIVAPVRFGDCRETFVFHGELEACHSVSIHAPELLETRLVTIRSVLDDGVRVASGDPVIELEDGDFQRTLAAAVNEVEVAEAELEKARFDLRNEGIDLELNLERRRLELERAKVAVVEDAVVFSKIELQKAKLGVEQAELDRKYAQAAVDEFKAKRASALKVKELALQQAKRKVAVQQENIARSVIRAPAPGIVYKPFIRLNNEMGRIEANKVVRTGDKLLELPSLDRFRGALYVPAADQPHLQPGDPASVTLTILPDVTFPAVVESVEPYPITRNERLGRNDPEGFLKEYRLNLSLPATDARFRPGLTFRAEISALIATACRYIPRAALVVSTGPDGTGTPTDPARADPVATPPVTVHRGATRPPSGCGVNPPPDSPGGRRVAAPGAVAQLPSGHGFDQGEQLPPPNGASANEADSTEPSPDGEVAAGASRADPAARAVSSPSGDAAQVWRRTATGAALHPIRTGRRGVWFVEVLAGLATGDLVCLDIPQTPTDEAGDDAIP